MHDKRSCPTFGIVGIIDFDLSDRLNSCNLASNFRATSQSAIVEWTGRGIMIATCQHTEDAGLDPGRYRFDLPMAGALQGIVYGSLFASANADELSPQSQTPVATTSAQLISDYAREGLGALRVLNGMWAAVMVDVASGAAIFARDVTGVETLYVSASGQQIAFASDLRLLARLGLCHQLDEQALAEFLHFLYVPAPRTAYRNICAVLPGHALKISTTGMQQQRFAPPRFVKGEPIGDATAVQQAIEQHLPGFEERLLTAVRQSLPRKGRVVLLLSGGKDSSALAIAASQVAPDRVTTLTVGALDAEVDESADAAALAAFLGLFHQTYTPSSDELVQGVQDMVLCQDQPFGDPASLPLFLALRSLPQDVTCIWDGTGNDYYFGSVRPSPLQRNQTAIRLKRLMPGILWQMFLRALSMGPARFRSQASEWGRPLAEVTASWCGWTLDELSGLCGREVSFSETSFWRLIETSDPADWETTYTELMGTVWSPHAAFRKGVHLAHECGLAIRYPFIDNRLAEYVCHLPQDLKYQGYTNKILLRAYLAKYLPEKLLLKPKGSFVFGLNHLLQWNNGEWPHTLHTKGSLQVLPHWSPSSIEQILACYARNPVEFADRVYALCLLATWAESR